MVTSKFTALDEYRLLGNSGLRVSPIALGTMTWGSTWGDMGGAAEDNRKVCDFYLEKGGNFFDTASVYQGGESEKALGEYLSSVRSQAVIATKFSLNCGSQMTPENHHMGKRIVNTANLAGNHRKSLAESLSGSLKRMGTGYTDILYVHMWEYRTPISEVLRALDDCVRSGKALYICISDVPAWVVSAANTEANLRGWSKFIGLQTRYNLLDRSFEFDLEPMCAEMGLGVVPWGSLAEGFVTGKYNRENASRASQPRGFWIQQHIRHERNWKTLETLKKIGKDVGRSPVQVSLNWSLHKRSITAPLVGARNVEQLEENLGCLDFELTPEQMEELDRVSDPYQDPDNVPLMPFPYSFEKSSAAFFHGEQHVDRPNQYAQLVKRMTDASIEEIKP